MNDIKACIAIPLKKFLTIQICPPRWKEYDLYLFGDGPVTFYVGQSHCAFDRVWEHLKGGPKGHSIVGRFLLANWPRSASFYVELISSTRMEAAIQSNDIDTAERILIENLKPCFNVSLNGQPTPLPGDYLPPNTPIKYLKNLRRMLREAGYKSHPSSEDLEWDQNE
jgi:hypothetical protein